MDRKEAVGVDFELERIKHLTMNIKTGLIQNGEVIFESLGGKITNRYTVNRITPTKAVTGKYKFERTVINGHVQIEGERKHLSYRYQISTPELETKWRQTLAIKKIVSTKLREMPLQRLEAMAALCG